MVKEFVEYWEERPETFLSSSIKWDTAAPSDEHVIVGDPNNPPDELEHGQLMWDGNSSSSGGGDGGGDGFAPVGGVEEAPDDGQKYTRQEKGWTPIEGGGGGLPVGMIVDFAGAIAPVNWVICDGTAYDRADQPELYDVIGTLYNTGGEGATEFRVPDFSNRVTIGPGNYPIGATGGSADSAMPAHEHGLLSHSHDVNDHGHTMPSHKHTMGTHKHTMGTHSHSINHNHGAANTTAGGAHQHDQLLRRDYSASGSSGRPGITNNSGVDVWQSGTAGGPMTVSPTHTHSFNMPNFAGTSGSTDPGDTGNTTPGYTSNMDPGDTHNKTGLTTKGSGASVTQSAGGGSAGLNYPPFMVANKIIKVV